MDKIITSRRNDIELVRLLGAFGIVWFHSMDPIGHNVAYGGLILFVVYAVYFSITSKKIHLLRDRFRRLIIPYLFWTGLYGLFNLSTSNSFFTPASAEIAPIFATPSIHLWFLPFIFIVLLIIDTFREKLIGTTATYIFCLLATVSLALSYIWRTFYYHYPIAQVLHVIPAVLIGLVYGNLSTVNKKAAPFIWIFLLLGSCVAIIMKVEGMGWTYLTGLLLTTPLVLKNSIIGNSRFISSLGSTTFGTYLLHPIIMEVFGYLKISGPLLAPTVFISSTVLIYTTQKLIPFKITRYMF